MPDDTPPAVMAGPAGLTIQQVQPDIAVPVLELLLAWAGAREADTFAVDRTWKAFKLFCLLPGPQADEVGVQCDIVQEETPTTVVGCGRQFTFPDGDADVVGIQLVFDAQPVAEISGEWWREDTETVTAFFARIERQPVFAWIRQQEIAAGAVFTDAVVGPHAP